MKAGLVVVQAVIVSPVDALNPTVQEPVLAVLGEVVVHTTVSPFASRACAEQLAALFAPESLKEHVIVGPVPASEVVQLPALFIPLSAVARQYDVTPLPLVATFAQVANLESVQSCVVTVWQFTAVEPVAVEHDPELTQPLSLVRQTVDEISVEDGVQEVALLQPLSPVI